ncbi:MAG: hypothetical protein KGI75_11440 [Rhizobiaceae bacterium]|nr:hypothetical protein [Rhizobiaceae bacterium]
MLKRYSVLGRAVLIAFLAMTTAGRADTISYADAVTTLARDCGADIQKLCRNLNLGNGQIVNCLQQNSAKVSPTCTSSLTTVIASIKQRQDAQAAYFNLCKGDIAQRCRGIKGDGYQLACLVKAQRIVSGKCNQAITDAGWR